LRQHWLLHKVWHPLRVLLLLLVAELLVLTRCTTWAVVRCPLQAEAPYPRRVFEVLSLRRVFFALAIQDTQS